MADLIWLHEDALRRTHPVFLAADFERGSDALPIYVWDMTTSLKTISGLSASISSMKHLLSWELKFTLAVFRTSCRN